MAKSRSEPELLVVFWDKAVVGDMEAAGQARFSSEAVAVVIGRAVGEEHEAVELIVI